MTTHLTRADCGRMVDNFAAFRYHAFSMFKVSRLHLRAYFEDARWATLWRRQVVRSWPVGCILYRTLQSRV